jgi:hypothetical protein
MSRRGKNNSTKKKKRRKANCSGHRMCGNCLLKHVIAGRI